MTLDLVEHYTKMAKNAMWRAARRMRASQGRGGRMLAPKVKQNGKRLGGRIATHFPRGKIAATNDGFAVTYGGAAVAKFHRGTPGRQVARPIFGLTPNEEEEIHLRTLAEVVRQLNKGVR